MAAKPSPAPALDWPMWGGTPARNMVSPGKNPPVEFGPGKRIRGKDEIDLATTKGLKWTVPLGSNSFGTPVVTGGRILLGTNNEHPRDPRYTDDRCVLLCLDEKTGALVWQMPSTKLGTGKVSDYEYVGIASTAAVDGDRVYLTTNRCEVVCLDLHGMANGNQGYQGEVSYYSTPECPITATSATDADVIWRFDMRDESGVFPHNMTASSVLVLGDRVYATTSNGVDWTHQNTPAPDAPCLICLDKATGKLLAEEASGISQRLMHCSWSSPAFAEIGGQRQIIFGGGDGFCYGFDFAFTKDKEGHAIFAELWRCDANPKQLRVDEAGQLRKYGHYDGPSEIIATPVFYKDKIYTVIGQEFEHGSGLGCLTCIDPALRGDLTDKVVWRYTDMDRTCGTPSIVDDILYVADFNGTVHALDAGTGAKLWTYDTKGHIWGGALYIDGKLYAGNEEGELHILSTGRDGGKKLNLIEFPGSLYVPPVYANGTLYMMTMSRLYAFGPK